VTQGRLAELSTNVRGDVVVGALNGEVDSSNAGELLAALGSAVPGGARGLVLDLGDLSYIDSAGIEMVFSLAGRLRARRQRLALVVPAQAPVARVLEISGVESVAQVLTDADTAAAAIGS